MSDYCVVVANASRARFFSVEKAATPSVEGGPNLLEREDLINPEKDLAGKDKWADTKSGRIVSTGVGSAHGFDDHRDRHDDEFLRRFASSITEKAIRMAEQQHAKKLVLVAEKRMLGFLRHDLEVPVKAGFEVQELAKDLTQLNTTELHEHLGSAGLIPDRHSPTG